MISLSRLRFSPISSSTVMPAYFLKRLLEAGYPLTGASDHGVSEAIYMNDPDGNGVELYWDKPKDEWPVEADGSLYMFTRALNIRDLLNEVER